MLDFVLFGHKLHVKSVGNVLQPKVISPCGDEI